MVAEQGALPNDMESEFQDISPLWWAQNAGKRTPSERDKPRFPRATHIRAVVSFTLRLLQDCAIPRELGYGCNKRLPPGQIGSTGRTKV